MIAKRFGEQGEDDTKMQNEHRPTSVPYLVQSTPDEVVWDVMHQGRQEYVQLIRPITGSVTYLGLKG